MEKENRTENQQIVNVDNPDKQEDNRRNEKGQFVKGKSGNPSGRAKGSVSLATLLKQELKKCPEGKKETYAELFVKRLLHLAMVEGNTQAYKLVMNYVDGLPTGDLGGEYIQNVLVNIIKPDDGPSNKLPAYTETVSSMVKTE